MYFPLLGLVAGLAVLAVGLGFWIQGHFAPDVRVLGVSTTSPEIIKDTLTQTFNLDILYGQTWVVFGMLLFGAIIVVGQIVYVLRQLSYNAKFGMRQIVVIAVIDMILVVVSAYGLAFFNAWLVQRAAPENVHVARLEAGVVHVTWETQVPAMSQILWGVAPQNLTETTLGLAGEQETTEHNVVLSVAQDQGVYFKILGRGGVKYPNPSTGVAYEVTPALTPGVLEEIPLYAKP